MKQHLKRCNLEDTMWCKYQKDGVYSCRVCQELSLSRLHFKQHIFDKHDDIQVVSKYARTAQDVIGPYYMKRFRAPLFLRITTGTLRQFLIQKIDPNGEFDWNNVDFNPSLLSNPDQTYRVRQLNLYSAYREIVLKLVHNF